MYSYTSFVYLVAQGMECILLCGQGMECILSCGQGMECILSCGQGMECILSCGQGMECILSCGQGMECILSCGQGMECILSCGQGMECILSCGRDVLSTTPLQRHQHFLCNNTSQQNIILFYKNILSAQTSTVLNQIFIMRQHHFLYNPSLYFIIVVLSSTFSIVFLI